VYASVHVLAYVRVYVCVYVNGKAKVKKSLYRHITGPEGSRRLRLPDFETVYT
jgi:hypothetical protein